MLPIGVQTGGLEELFGEEEAYRVIKEAGFDAADANIDHLMSWSDVVNKRLPSWFEPGHEKELLERVQPWKNGAKKYGVVNYQAHAPLPSFLQKDPEDPFNEIMLDVMKKCIMACDAIDCRRLIIHPAYCDYQHRLDPDKEWEINMARYAALIPVAKKYGVTICLENMFTANKQQIFGAVCSDIPTACRYIDELNALAGEKVFGFCLDTGHLLLVGKDVKEAMTQLGDRIEAFHIHDNDGRTDQHLAPYMGVLDWDRFGEGLQAIRYNKTLSFETFNVARRYPVEMVPQALRLIADTGRLFASRIE